MSKNKNECLLGFEILGLKDAKTKAFEYFDGKFATSYTKDQITEALHWFPKGIVSVESNLKPEEPEI